MKLQIERKTYPDGSFYTKIEASAEGNTLTFRINSYEDLWQLAQIKDALKSYGTNNHLIIPCLFDAQHDRRFNAGESHNLKLICEFINRMGWNSVSIFHPHNQEVVEALIDNVKIIDNSKFIHQVLWHLAVLNNSILTNEMVKTTFNFYYDRRVSDKTVLMGTDAGSFKWLSKLAEKLNWQGEVYNASKSRTHVDGESKLVQHIDREDFDGKDVLLVDDICVFGGTFLGLAKLLRERNVGRLYLAVSHITVQYPNEELWTTFDKVFTTNSKGYDYSYFEKPRPNLEIIKIFED